MKNVENPTDILEVGAKEFVNDLLKLTKPMSQIRKSGYTHLIDSFAYRVKKDEVEAIRYFRVEELERLENEGFEWLDNLKKII